MYQIEIEYKGGLRTEAVHLKSGQRIITDAPLDNKGNGEPFSPTDLTAGALGSCMLTIMGITAASRNMDITGTRAEVEKLVTRLQEKNLKFTIQPQTSFSGKAGEQSTFFIEDPFGNALEFKAFQNDDDIFAV